MWQVHSSKAGSINYVHINRFGVILKDHQSNKWWLIVDLSHPVGHSVSDEISKQLCSLKYITVDTAISHIITFGPGTLLAKINIKHAFRLLPVHPVDRHFLAMHWNNNIYIDTCLPFGLRSVPKLFNILVDLLSWIVEAKGVAPIFHYLDNFLLLHGSPSSDACLSNLNIVEDIIMHTTWHTISLRKTGRSIPITNLLGQCLGCPMYGGKASR